MNWNTIGDPAANQGRTELVRYDSPTWHGFIYSASIAEAGDYWGNMLRYANEFNGVRVAAGIGYERSKDRATPATIDPTGAFWVSAAPDIQAWGVALSLMHIPSGLFVQGHWAAADFNAPGHIANAYWGSAGGTTKKDTTHWLIQGGISKNWFGIGNTALYGEYGVTTDWGAESAGRNFAGTTSTASCPGGGGPNAVCSQTIANFSTVNGVIDTDMTIWGIGHHAERRCGCQHALPRLSALRRRHHLYRGRCNLLGCCRRSRQAAADRADPRHRRWRGREVLSRCTVQRFARSRLRAALCLWGGGVPLLVCPISNMAGVAQGHRKKL